MADVTKIPGPVPQEPNKSSEPVRPGTDKFKEFMKIGESDKRQGKKREQREEGAAKKGALRTGVSSQRVSEPVRKEKPPKIQKVGESEKRQPQGQKRSEEAAALEEVAAAQQNQQKIEAFDVSKVETSSLEKKGATPAYNPAAAQAAEEQIAAQEEKVEEVKLFARQQEQKKTEAVAPQAPPAASTLGPQLIPPAPPIAPGYTALSGDALVLFEKMVSQILLLLTTGETRTTITIGAGSQFAGTQITISEFSTAPKVFNIEFQGTNQNNQVFEANIATLRAAFDSDKSKFSVHNIRTSLLKSERPEFRRVERKKEEEM